MCHPFNIPSLKTIDYKWSYFSNDPRNVRLAMVVDGFNPFGSLSSTHSVCLVVLITYNLMPWLCMKRRFCLLSLLIHGPKKPGNNIDVYLEPVVIELKLTWDEGERPYDAHSRSFFNMKAILMWVIHDFPVYGNMDGCTTKRFCACPICGKNTDSMYLKSSRKCVYMGHRRYIPINHKYHSQKGPFNGKSKHLIAPTIVQVSDIFTETEGREEKKGKSKSTERKRNLKKGENSKADMWKKRSILFNLPYWEVCAHINLRPKMYDV